MWYAITIALLIYLLVTYWPLFLLGLFLVILFVIYKKTKSTPEPCDTTEYIPENIRYTISANVTKAFYDEAWRYCRKHNLKMSDLVRDSVKEYMERNK